MWGKILLVLAFCAFLWVGFSVHVSAQDRLFLITETELTSIEQQKQTWETSKATWLSQVHVLKTTADNLLLESQGLNKALQLERQTTAQLKESFNKYESENLVKTSLLTSENSSLTIKNKALEADLLVWRFLAIGIMVLVALVIALFIWMKIKGVAK